MTDAFSTDSRLLLSFAIAFLVAASLTPIARRTAFATGLVDRPEGWKTHLRPTPLLGGAAVLTGTAAGALLAPDLRTLTLLLCGALALSLVGTVDDAVYLPVSWRLGIELACGGYLWAVGLGWKLGVPEPMNFALTCIWVVAIVNAFNAIDLMDTVASFVLVASAGGLAVLAVLEGETTAAVLGVAVAGAALGFLPFNAKRSYVFLGDGGTMPLGFLVAALVILTLDSAAGDPRSFIVAPLLFCVPLADAIWRACTRLRGGVSLLTAGHDSLANSLQRQGVTPSRVGFSLAAVNAGGVCLAILVIRGGSVGAGLAAAVIVTAAPVASWPNLASLLLRRPGQARTSVLLPGHRAERR